MTRVSDRLVTQAFYISAHKDIYQAAIQLHATYQPTDLLSVTAWLSDHNLLNRIGGRNKLATLVDRTVSAVDYLQQIPLSAGGNMAFEVGKITRQIRDIAKSHKIPVFLGCQINRGNQTTADKRPNRHLLRNSGEIFEVCDQLIMLYRDAVYTKDPSDRTIELIVEKNRLYGKLGTATMLCDLSTSKFLNLAR